MSAALDRLLAEFQKIDEEARAAERVRGRNEYDFDEVCQDVSTPAPTSRSVRAAVALVQSQILEREQTYLTLRYSERPTFKMWMRPISGADWGDEPDEDLSVVSIDDLLLAESSAEFDRGLATDDLRLLVRWEAMLDVHDGRCLYCGQQSEQLQMDHVMPRARGGIDSFDNIVPACFRCNASKCAKPLGAWLDTRPDLSRVAITSRWERTGRGGSIVGLVEAGRR